MKKTLFLTPAALLCAAVSLMATDAESDGTWNPENARVGTQGTSFNISVEKENVPDMGDVSTLVVQSDQVDGESSIIELGRIPADPSKNYRAVYYVKAEVDEGAEGLYLMIRDHAALQGGPPLNKEYHKLPTPYRRIPGRDIGSWVKKEFVFTPGEGAEFLGGALVVSPFKGRIVISPVQLIVDEGTGAPEASSKKRR